MKADIKITIPSKNYPLDAVLATCNELSDTGAAFLLKKNEHDEALDVIITYAPESDDLEKAQRDLIEIFKTVLLENNLRFSLIANNRSLREQLVYNALSNPVFFEDTAEEPELPESIAKLLEEDGESEESYLDDPLKIAVPWEEKNK